MAKRVTGWVFAMLLTAALLAFGWGTASAAARLEGQAQAGAAPLANATITLWAASESSVSA